MPNLFHFPTPVFSPDEGGGASAPSTPTSSTAPGGGDQSPPASSTPASAPSTTAPAPQSTPDKGGLSDAPSAEFTLPDFGEEILDEVVIQAEAPPVAPAEAQPQAPTEQPPAEQPPKAPVQEPPKDTGTQEQPPAQTSPGTLSQMLQDNREALIDGLAQTHFALSPAEVEALNEDAVAAVPRLLAKVHLDAVSTMLTHMTNIVPRMIQYHQRVTQANDSAKSKFFDAWPDLKPETHGSKVAEIARLYRQLHPNASLDEVIRDVGPLAMQTLGVVAKPKTNGKAPQATPPFVPARGGGATPPTAPTPDPFAGLGMDFD